MILFKIFKRICIENQFKLLIKNSIRIDANFCYLGSSGFPKFRKSHFLLLDQANKNRSTLSLYISALLPFIGLAYV